MDKKDKCKKLVAKHNKLIEFRGRMSASELKLFGLVIADVREHQEEQFEEYQIDVSVLKETTEHKDFYNYISKVAFKLESKRLLVDGISDNGSRYRTSIRLINKPKIEENSKDLRLTIDKDLIPYILDLKGHFTRYQIENILKLGSGHSVRVYELLKQEEYRGFREIDLKELREYLGIEKGEYERFYDFERWVLKVAKKEINEHTDLIVDYEKIKSGRRISKIMFKIDPKDMEKELYIEYLDKNYRIKDIKQMAGLSQENFNSEQIIELYGIAVKKLEDHEEKDILEYIRLNYLYVKDKAGNGKYSYLKKTLKEDYAVAEGQIKFDYYIK